MSVWSKVAAVTVALLAGAAVAAAAVPVAEGVGAVAAEHRLASIAGVEMLDSGGNAVDAAVAAALATGVVNPSSSGLGGGGFMVVYLAHDGRAHAVDFREAAPAAASRDMYVSEGKVDASASVRGGLAVAIPGEPAGLELALTRFGSKSFAEVARPAIRLAREGFEVEPHLASMIERFHDAIAADPALSHVFLHSDGRPYRAGERLARPGLASTLEMLASRGSTAFYSGPLAVEIVAAANRRGGILRASDLSEYRAVQRPPLTAAFRGMHLITMPPPSSGGGTMAEALAILAPYDLAALGAGSPTYLHLLAETLKAAFADRATYYGDPDFVTVPLARLLSAAHAAQIRRRFSSMHPVPASEYGRVGGVPDHGTSHISVIDRDGNAVALTTSINTPFGSFVAVPDRGLILNDTMDDFSVQPGVPNAYGLIGNEANSIAPRKRPLSSMSPTIVLQGGHARLALGASGGPLIISATLQTLLNATVFGMDVGQAVDAARIHHQWRPDVVAVEPRLDAAIRASLERRGHRVRQLAHGAAVAAVTSVRVDGKTRVRAVSDPRKGGVAAAYKPSGSPSQMESLTRTAPPQRWSAPDRGQSR